MEDTGVRRERIWDDRADILRKRVQPINPPRRTLAYIGTPIDPHLVKVPITDLMRPRTFPRLEHRRGETVRGALYRTHIRKQLPARECARLLRPR